jgi:hypothetical protein
MSEFITLFNFHDLINENITFVSLIIRLVIAAVLSTGISLIYSKVNSDKDDKYVMMQTLIFLAVTIAGAMLIIGNNLARAFGLLGAVSIIRFRTAVKSSRDMAFVFLAIVVGMACGLGYLALGLITAIFVGFLMLFFFKIRLGQGNKQLQRINIKISYNGSSDFKQLIEDELAEFTDSWKFNMMKIDNNVKRYVYTVWVDKHVKQELLINSLLEKSRQNEISISILYK